MNVRSVSMFNHASKVNFAQDKEEKKAPAEVKTQGYENPISRKKEKNLAVLSIIGGSVVFGTIIGGLTTCLKPGNWKLAGGVGLAAAVIAAAITLPSKLYNTAVNAFAREKEMDVYSRDKALKTSLTEEVHKEVLNPEVSLDKKLDDNLKLQTANRGSSLVIQH